MKMKDWLVAIVPASTVRVIPYQSSFLLIRNCVIAAISGDPSTPDGSTELSENCQFSAPARLQKQIQNSLIFHLIYYQS